MNPEYLVFGTISGCIIVGLVVLALQISRAFRMNNKGN